MLAQASATTQSGFGDHLPTRPGPSVSWMAKDALRPANTHRLLAPKAKEDQQALRYRTRETDADEVCRSAQRSPGDRVLACTRALLGMSPTDERRADLYVQRASAYYVAGAWEMALDDFELSLEHNPDLPMALNGRCWILASKNLDLVQARRDCDRAIALDPTFHEAYDSRAIIDLREGDWTGAWQNFNAAVDLRAQVPAFLFGRGLASLALGEAEAAERDMAAALAIDPDIAFDYRKLGFDAAILSSGASDAISDREKATEMAARSMD